MRLFVGLPIPMDIAHQLAQIAKGHGSTKSDSYSRPDDMHITLKYLGEADDCAIDARLRQIAYGSFNVDLTKSGVFEAKPQNVLWAGVSDVADNLGNLKALVERSLGDVIPIDERTYRPHISLVFSNSLNFKPIDLPHKTICFDRFVLYRISDASEGQQFIPLKEYPLCESMTLVCINDFHAQLDKAQQMTDVLSCFRRQNPETTLLYGGDSYFSDPVSDRLMGLPVSSVMKAQGVSYSCVGNHDWEYGRRYFETWQKDGGFQFLCANASDKTLFKPWATIQGKNRKVAILGFSTSDEMPSPETANDMRDVTFEPIVETAHKYRDEILAHNPDAIIALTHFGMKMGPDGAPVGHEIEELCKGCAWLDGAFGAHWHQFVQSNLFGIPVAEGGGNGQGFSYLKLLFSDAKAKPVVIPRFIRLCDLAHDWEESSAVDLMLEDFRKKTSAETDKVLATLTEDLLNKDPIHNEMPVTGSALGNLAVNLMKDSVSCNVALYYAGRMGLGFQKGPVTVYNMEKTLSFENRIVLIKASGAEVLKNIETGLRTIRKDSLSPVAVAGFNVVVDMSKPWGQRIISATDAEDKAIDANRTYTVATDVFIASNAVGFHFTNSESAQMTDKTVRQLIRDNLEHNGSIASKTWISEVEV
ncbi:MAG: RNA 2',3'-cyclic phosphodiesterase [Sphaerochaetaceae bacterium]|nr:RNA 2',3'-cyclic phosphodiesterase [Sphaerochaetaceae bacterium]